MPFAFAGTSLKSLNTGVSPPQKAPNHAVVGASSAPDALLLLTGALDVGQLDAGALDMAALDSGALDTDALDSGALEAGALVVTALELDDDAGAAVPLVELHPASR